ncbi:hypothetical protein DENSPDRAFT_869416 [Dentipellis sp. KUC8613]|nr:hypothetical protein DENSPDRAFT_869416 [Dentipellis sp. KUC8613]
MQKNDYYRPSLLEAIPTTGSSYYPSFTHLSNRNRRTKKHEVTATSFSNPTPPPPSPPSSTLVQRDLCIPISSQAPATRWLLQNVHDPYPSSAEFASLSEACDCTVKAVQEWFSFARRRIGWTDLSREKFGGSRLETSQAATRAYAEDVDNGLPLDIKRAFSVIKTNALNLFEERITDSDDGVEACRPTSAQVPDSYLPLLSAPIDDEDDMTPPPPIAGCKRTLDAIGESDANEADMAHAELESDPWPSKRLRFSSLSPAGEGRASNNQIAPSGTQIQPAVTRCSFNSDHRVALIPTAAVTTVEDAYRSPVPAGEALAKPSPLPQKRRLSDVSAEEHSKRSRGLNSGPRRQTVSNPLPLTFGSGITGIQFSEDWVDGLNDAFRVSNTIDTNDFNSQAILDTDNDTSSAVQINNREIVSPVCELDINDADLVAAMMITSFDLSSSVTIAQSNIIDSSGPSTFKESFDPSEYQSVSDLLFDWSQFDAKSQSLGSSSPTLSLTSLSSDSSLFSTPSTLSDNSFSPSGHLAAEPAASLPTCSSDMLIESSSLSLPAE